MNLDRRSAHQANRLALLAFLALVLGLTGCQGPFPQTTFSATTEFGADLAGLFRMIFWWAVVVFVVVQVGVIYVVIRFRSRPGQADPTPVHGHTALEIAWTLAPAMIIVFIAVPSIRVIWKDATADTENAVRVEVIGHQWWWEYRYPDYGIVTAGDLHLPQGRPVELQLTSADVIHSFWLPRLAGKRDMILGRSNRLVFTPDSVGEFWGQCAEYCGTSHANMRFRAFVHAPADFEAWVQQQTSPPAPEAALSAQEAEGLSVFRTRGCLACHTIDGVAAGVLGPNLNHFGSRSTVAGGILENTPENLAAWLRDPPAVKPGSLMQNFNLTEAEITALVAYLRSLR